MEIDKTIVFGILAKDCRDHLHGNMSRVEKAGEMFADYKVIIYENDSTDGTDALVRKWVTANPNVSMINEPLNYEKHTFSKEQLPRPDMGIPRIEKMVYLRNRLLDEVKAHYKPDLFCFLDIDVESFQPESIFHAVLNAPENWGGLMANGHFFVAPPIGFYVKLPFQYDSFAFFQLGVEPHKTGNWIVSRHFSKLTSYASDVLLRRHAYLSCRSAFNGIGIYKWDAIKNSRYRIEQNAELKAINACFCEHVPFNGDVADKGYGIYQVRDMEVIYHHERTSWEYFWRFFRRIMEAWFLLKGKKYAAFINL